MRGYPFGIRRQDFDTDIDHHEHMESNEMPHLLNTSSGSSSSHGSSPHSGPRHHRKMKKHHHHGSEDNSILRGAEILRRQLISDDDEDDEDPYGHSYEDSYENDHNSGGHNLSLEELSEDEESEDNEEWSDPWSSPKTRHKRELHVSTHNRAGSWAAEEAEEKTAFSSPVGDAAEWARLSDDEGGENAEEEDNEGESYGRQTSDRKRHCASGKNSLGLSPESRKDRSIREKVASHFSYHEADTYCEDEISQSHSNERNYLPGGLTRTAVDLFRVRPDHHHPASPTHWENASDSVSSHTMDLLKDLESEERALNHMNCEEEMSYLLEATRLDPGANMMKVSVVEDSPQFESVVSPRSQEYEKLKKDPAYQHAQRAGMLWQSLLSQHVRFPAIWWNGNRSPAMGVTERRMWTYMGRHRVEGNQYLNGLVRSRGSAGRLLLHLVVRDIVTMSPVQDIAVGCFHPNSRGIRATAAFDPSIEDSRDIWVALRKRSEDVSVMDSLLKLSEDEVSASPLGGKHAIDNNNMRAVFGETPPIQTVFVLESELYEVFSHFMDSNIPPAAILLGRYLKEWY